MDGAQEAQRSAQGLPGTAAPGARERRQRRQDTLESEFSYKCPGTFPTDDGRLSGRCFAP